VHEGERDAGTGVEQADRALDELLDDAPLAPRAGQSEGEVEDRLEACPARVDDITALRSCARRRS
jgi:hypothetical protein